MIFDDAFMGIKYLPPGRGESSVEEGGGVVLVKDVIKNDSLIAEGEHEGKKAGRLLPLFRGANTDLNTTLAIAIVAMFFVHLLGNIRAWFKKIWRQIFKLFISNNAIRGLIRIDSRICESCKLYI